MEGPTILGYFGFMADVLPPMVWLMAYLVIGHVARFAMHARAGLKPMYRPMAGGPQKIDFLASVPTWTSLRYTFGAQHRAVGDSVLTLLVWINRVLFVGFFALMAVLILGLYQR